MRRRLSNPLAFRRLGVALAFAAMALSAVAVVLREHRLPGSGGHSATYLIDVLSWLTACAAAVIEVRAASLLLGSGFPGARRRAIIFAIVGVLLVLGGCIAGTVLTRGDAPLALRVIAAAAIPAGVALGLGGIGSLAWVYGLEAASSRIDKLSDEDW